VITSCSRTFVPRVNCFVHQANLVLATYVLSRSPPPPLQRRLLDSFCFPNMIDRATACLATALTAFSQSYSTSPSPAPWSYRLPATTLRPAHPNLESRLKAVNDSPALSLHFVMFRFFPPHLDRTSFSEAPSAVSFCYAFAFVSPFLLTSLRPWKYLIFCHYVAPFPSSRFVYTLFFFSIITFVLCES